MKPLIALALVMIPVPVLAQSTSGRDTQASQDERKICRAVTNRASSSRLPPRRLCLTRLEWRHRDDVSTDDAQDTFGVRARDTEMPGHQETPR